MIFINRVLYGVIGFFLLLGASVWLIPLSPPKLQDFSSEKIKIKPFSVQKTSSKIISVKTPKKNIFDINGKDWSSKQKQKISTSTKQTSSILGILKLHNIKGILTNTGVIYIGSPFNDGILTRIEKEHIVIKTDNKEKKLKINNLLINKTIKFKSLGFPFLN